MSRPLLPGTIEPTQRLVAERLLDLTDPSRPGGACVQTYLLGIQPRPLVPVELDFGGGFQLLIKDERQHPGTRSAYDRAAAAALLGALDRNDTKERGVVVATDNGFGLAIAQAALRATNPGMRESVHGANNPGIPASIVCARGVTRTAIRKMRAAGATLYGGCQTLAEAASDAKSLADATGATYIHHANSVDTIAGYAAIGQEMAAELWEPDMDPLRVFVPTSASGGALRLGVQWALDRVATGSVAVDGVLLPAGNTTGAVQDAVAPSSLLVGLSGKPLTTRVAHEPYIEEARALVCKALDLPRISELGAAPMAAALEYIDRRIERGNVPSPGAPETVVALVGQN